MLQDGLAGRKALLRAYETVSDRVSDPRAKEVLHRFAAEEREEYLVGEAISRRYGADPSKVQGIRNEVASILGRRAFTEGGGPYKDVRNLSILYGLESAGHAGAEFMKNLARSAGDQDWVEATERSIHRSEDHLQSLERCIEDLSHFDERR